MIYNGGGGRKMLRTKKTLYDDWLLKWLEIKKNYVKESTYANYSNIVFNYIKPYFKGTSLSKLKSNDIQKFILYCYKEKYLSPKTIKDIIIIIKMSLREANGYGIYDYFEVKFKYPKNLEIIKIKTLSKREQNIIIKYCQENPNSKSLGLLLTIFSGIRIGELCALKYSDFNLKTKEVTINKTIQRIYIKENELNGKSKIITTNAKTKKSNRIIPLHKIFCDFLKNLNYENDDFFISNSKKQIEPRTYRKYYSNVLNHLKIKHINFHALRHTFASNCIKNGIDPKTVSELLGHSSVNITLNLYVHSSEEQKRKCINSIYKE
jgi:integrase